MTNEDIANETNEWNDHDGSVNGVKYTCSDSVRIEIDIEAAKLSSTRAFTDYLDSRGDTTDYLNNGVLMGWQDYFVEARFRTLKGRDQLAEEVRAANFTQEQYDIVLYGPEED